MVIHRNIVHEIKQRNAIVDIISKHVKLKAQNRDQWTGLCPFHGEKTPSFSVKPSKNYFHCFGCNAHGDEIAFIQKIQNVQFLDAVKYIADMLGIQMRQDISDDNDLYYEIVKIAQDFYVKNLTMSKRAMEYLSNRGLSQNTIESFGIGYSSRKDETLSSYLQKIPYESNTLVEYSLARKSQNGKLYDFFAKNRIMIPIKDRLGKTIGFGARAIDEEVEPKYINTAENKIFKKNTVIFNINSVLASKKAHEPIIVVEGYMDAISLHQHGFLGVATMGTSVSTGQMEAILKITKNPIIGFDNDNAGKNASLRLAKMLLTVLKTGNIPKFLDIKPQYKDIDEILQSHNGKEYLKTCIENAVEIQDFIFRHESTLLDLRNPNIASILISKLMDYIEAMTDRQLYWQYKQFFRNKIYEIQKTNNMNIGTKNKTLANQHISSMSVNISTIEYKIVASIFLYIELFEEWRNQSMNISQTMNDIIDIFVHYMETKYNQEWRIDYTNKVKDVIMYIRNKNAEYKIALDHIVDSMKKLKDDIKFNTNKREQFLRLLYHHNILSIENTISKQAEALSLADLESLKGEITSLHIKISEIDNIIDNKRNQ